MDTAIGDNEYRYINGGQAAIYYTSEAYTKLENEIAKLKKKNKKLKKKLKGHRYFRIVNESVNATGSGGDGYASK
jgi:hypothetical protein